MIKHCLGCDIEFDGSPQSKYHNEACSDKARKRKQRESFQPVGGICADKDPKSDLSVPPVVSKGDSRLTEKVNEIEAVMISCIQPNRRGAMPLELDPSLKNTINDPNPDWAPDKIITENNRTMTCPICGKLSLTHKRIEDGGNGPCFPYMGRISSKL